MKKTFFPLLLIFSFVLTSCRYCTDASDTAYNEFKASSLLKKYEWFKDAAAQLDAKVATLHTYDARFTALNKSYGADSLSHRNWARDDREQFNIWQSEYTGLKASYNELAAEYNAAMAKFNYAFCNVGTLPEGADTPLPRNFKPYINN